MSIPWLELVIQDLALDCADLDLERIEAVAEAATYRQLLLIALEGWETEKCRADASTQRLRQLMGREPWHREEVP